MDANVTSTKTCKHCNTNYEGNFCPSCGQKFIDQRITLRNSLGYLFQSLINLDRGLWHTSWLMFRNPGKVIRDFLKGVTVPYFHPFRFVFFWLTLQVLFLVSTGFYQRVQDSINAQMGATTSASPAMEGFMHIYYSYMNIFMLLALPAMALGSWIVFRKKGYNYAEHLVLGAYTYGAISLMGLLFSPVLIISIDYFAYGTLLTMPLTFIYQTYVYRSLFRQNWIVLFFKSLFTFALFMFGFMLIVMIVLVIYMLSLSPEELKSFAPPKAGP